MEFTLNSCWYRKNSCVVLLMVLLAGPQVATAAPSQYRCSGRVQYYPCAVKLFGKRPGDRRSPAPAEAKSAGVAASAVGPKTKGLFAEVETSTYQVAAKNQGWWRGTVRGNGLVELELHIFRPGKAAEARTIGQVPLKNHTTWFSFKSPRPAGSKWTWKILARAKAGQVG